MEGTNNTGNTMHEIFGDPISIYSREQAILDGFLIDLTEWASADKGFLGGFTIPVAVTASVWADINRVPRRGLQDVRGRAHDLLWMASLAARRNSSSDAVLFRVIMQVGRTRNQVYKMVCSGNDDGTPCITIMQRNED